ncbi:MAG: hypothetical protein GX604_03160 [Actinobacteria bacterium]|nr:hypothetical protein [Actinomycetota bacterium]
MRCREVRKMLVAYLDGELAPSECAAIDVHLARCRSCEGDLAALGRTRVEIADGMRRLAVGAVPSIHAWSRLQAVIMNRDPCSAGAATAKTVGRRALSPRRRIALVAAVTVALGVGVVAALPTARSAAEGLLWDILNLNRHHLVSTEAGYLPEGFESVPVDHLGKVDVSSPGGEGGSAAPAGRSNPTEELLYRSGNWYLLIRTSSDGLTPLPEGRATEVNGNDAVVITGPSALASLPEQLVVDLEGAVGQEGAADMAASSSVAYRDTRAIVWVQSGVRVEVVSNLPEDEIRKIAYGLIFRYVEGIWRGGAACCTSSRDTLGCRWTGAR